VLGYIGKTFPSFRDVGDSDQTEYEIDGKAHSGSNGDSFHTKPVGVDKEMAEVDVHGESYTLDYHGDHGSAHHDEELPEEVELCLEEESKEHVPGVDTGIVASDLVDM